MRIAESMTPLNRMLTAFQYSLATYLSYARPWTHFGNARLLEAVRETAADHDAHARRLGRLILKRRGKVEADRFPTQFTAYNDLALDYLAPRLVEHERKLVDLVARNVLWLGDDTEARHLGEAIFAIERQHLRTLTELVSSSLPRNESHPVPSLAA
jgi:hypothetical protein